MTGTLEPRGSLETHLEQLTKILTQLTQPLLTYGPRFKVAQYYTRNTIPPELGYYTLSPKQSRVMNIGLFSASSNTLHVRSDNINIVHVSFGRLRALIKQSTGRQRHRRYFPSHCEIMYL